MLIKIDQSAPSATDVRLEIANIVEKEYAHERATAENRDANARWVAQNLHSGKTTALGKCIAVVPLVDAIRLEAKYGKHLKEKSFWKYYQKHHREMCPASI